MTIIIDLLGIHQRVHFERILSDVEYLLWNVQYSRHHNDIRKLKINGCEIKKITLASLFYLSRINLHSLKFYFDTCMAQRRKYTAIQIKRHCIIVPAMLQVRHVIIISNLTTYCFSPKENYEFPCLGDG